MGRLLDWCLKQIERAKIGEAQERDWETRRPHMPTQRDQPAKPDLSRPFTVRDRL